MKADSYLAAGSSTSSLEMDVVSNRNKMTFWKPTDGFSNRSKMDLLIVRELREAWKEYSM